MEKGSITEQLDEVTQLIAQSEAELERIEPLHEERRSGLVAAQEELARVESRETVHLQVGERRVSPGADRLPHSGDSRQADAFRPDEKRGVGGRVKSAEREGISRQSGG